MPNYRAMTRAAARRHGLDPDVFAAQISQESGFNPSARSPAGALGIAQIMPATARGWGVDPMDPAAALDAAAKNMARYVRQFGSYEKALRAYNAGPGNVERSRGFSETNNYVRTILGGKTPSPAGAKGGGGGGGGGGGLRTETTTTPGVDNSGARAAALSSFFEDRREGKGNSFTHLALKMNELRDTPGSTRTRILGGGGGEHGGTGAANVGGGKGWAGLHGSGIKELFWQGAGGVNLDEGHPVPQGFVSGHTDHVHVAAGPKTVVRIGRLAQQMGLHVGENPHFGGVDPVHAEGSFHYRPGGQAIDVSGDPNKMRRFAHRVARYQRRR